MSLMWVSDLVNIACVWWSAMKCYRIYKEYIFKYTYTTTKTTTTHRLVTKRNTKGIELSHLKRPYTLILRRRYCTSTCPLSCNTLFFSISMKNSSANARIWLYSVFSLNETSSIWILLSFLACCNHNCAFASRFTLSSFVLMSVLV